MATLDEHFESAKEAMQLATNLQPSEHLLHLADAYEALDQLRRDLFG